MVRVPARSTRTDRLVPDTTLVRAYLEHRDEMRRRVEGGRLVLVLEGVPAALRRRLVEKRVAFISPGTQFYVPEAFLDLRETYSSQPAAPSEQLSPTAQVLVLAALLGHEINDANMTRSEERRVGKECFSTCRSRWWTNH